jgi:hypothetical protein
MSTEQENQTYKVFWKGSHPKPKKVFHDGQFASRQKARQWCKNHFWYDGLSIIDEQGKVEAFNPGSKG